MSKPDVKMITLGKIGSSYGVRGWLKVSTFTEFGASILQYNPWYLQNKDGSWEGIEVEDSKLHGKSIIVKLAGINNPEEAKLYADRRIAVPEDRLPKLEENEYYWHDLIGLTVTNKEGENLGEVIGLMETGANDVLIVKGKKEHAIPYLPGRVVLNINLQTREIKVDWDII